MDHVILVLVQTTCIMWSAKSDSTERAVDRRRWFIRRNSHEPNINSSNVVYQNDVFPRCSLKIKIGVDRRLNRFGSCEIQPLNRASFPSKSSFPRDTWPWPKFTWQSCSCSTCLLLPVNTCYPFLYSSIGLRSDTSMHDKTKMVCTVNLWDCILFRWNIFLVGSDLTILAFQRQFLPFSLRAPLTVKFCCLLPLHTLCTWGGINTAWKESTV